MKKCIAMLLALVLAFSLVSVVAVADDAKQPQIVIDGVKDADYSDKRVITPDYWSFFDNQGQGYFDPVDVDRVQNTAWFTWDDESVYIYFECVSKDDLYVPAADETSVPSFDYGPFYEIAQIYLDTAPSLGYCSEVCNWRGQDGNEDGCIHFACNANTGEGAPYRLMARANPAWYFWNDYYAPAAGMFMTYEEFCNNYAGRAGYEDLAAKYEETHGNGLGQAATFIDYDTNTYGFELKFPRAEGEEYFQFNVRTRVNEKEWDEEGPELAYSLSFCKAWWMNSEELLTIYFEDYEEGSIDPKVAAIIRQMEELPLDIELLGLEHKNAVNKIVAEFEALDEELIGQFTEDQLAWIIGAAMAMERLDFVASIGDINNDSKVNANDALIALRAAVGKTELDEEATLRADVNGDGEINAKDALEMLQFAVGKREKFTIVEMMEAE